MLISRRNMMAAALAAPALMASGRLASAVQTLKISHQFPGGTLEEGDFRDRLCRRFAAELENAPKGRWSGRSIPTPR
jgi:TRAP-type transport system periplasmic protein